jgi:hypothetical protein
MALGNLKIAETLDRGTPMASPNKLIGIYGDSGCGKTTAVIKYLELSGKSAVYLDIDGNSAPIIAAPQSVLDKMNYLKLRNSLTQLYVMDFINGALVSPQLLLCQRHGYLSCPTCKKQGDPSIRVNFDDFGKYDVLVVDSASLLINAVKLFSIKQQEASQSNDLRAIWQRVSLASTTLLHFLREVHETVIVLSHPLDVRYEPEKGVYKAGPKKGEPIAEPYYMPRFGTVPFSREVVGSLTETIFMDDAGGIVTNAKKPYFANTRVEIKSSTAHGALLEIIDRKYMEGH